MNVLLVLLLLLAAAVRAEVLCQSVAQSAAMAPGDTQSANFVAVYVPGSCECAFLPQPGANITCCTDETWAPVATDVVGACACLFTAHIAIPADTFNFYACANTVL